MNLYCETCQHPRPGSTHHIDGDPRNNDPSNLRITCPACGDILIENPNLNRITVTMTVKVPTGTRPGAFAERLKSYIDSYQGFSVKEISAK